MKSNIGVSMIENFREELKQTLEDKKRVEQKIVDLKEALSEAIGELYALDETVKSVSQRESPALQPPNVINVDVGKAWNIFYRWVIPIAILIALLWLSVVVSVQDNTPDTNVGWEIPSMNLMPTAQACTLLDRIQERRAMPLVAETADGSLQTAEDDETGNEVTDSAAVCKLPSYSNRPLIKRPLLRNLFSRICKT